MQMVKLGDLYEIRSVSSTEDGCNPVRELSCRQARETNANRVDAPNDEFEGECRPRVDAPDAWRFSIEVAKACSFAGERHPDRSAKYPARENIPSG